MRHRLVLEGSAGVGGGALDPAQVSAQPRPEILKLGQLCAVETLGCVVEQHVAALDVAGCEDREGRQRLDRRGLAVGERRVTAGEVVQRAHDRLAGAHRMVQRDVVIGVDFAPVDPAVVVAVARAEEQPSAAAFGECQSRPMDPRHLAELSERGPHPRIPVSDRSARDPVPHLVRIGPREPPEGPRDQAAERAVIFGLLLGGSANRPADPTVRLCPIRWEEATVLGRGVLFPRG